MPRCQHRIQQKDFGGGNIDRQAIVVTHGTKSFGIAIKADVPNAGVRRHAQNSIHHPETGTQNRHKHNRLRQNSTSTGSERSFHFNRPNPPPAGCFREKKDRDLLQMPPEQFRRTGLIAQN